MMTNNTTPISNNEYVLKALYQHIFVDFKDWLMADTKPLQVWKNRKGSIKACSGRLIDDVEAMLKQFRTKSQDNLLPVMLVAIAKIATPPDTSLLRAIPFMQDGMIESDAQKRHIKFRAIPMAYRVQLAFVSPDSDSSSSLLAQFSAYMQDDFKRRFEVEYHLAQDVQTSWAMTVFDNSLYPDRAMVEQENLEIGLVDFTIGGYIPQVVGLHSQDSVVPETGQIFYDDTAVATDERPMLGTGKEWLGVTEVRVIDKTTDVVLAHQVTKNGNSEVGDGTD